MTWTPFSRPNLRLGLRRGGHRHGQLFRLLAKRLDLGAKLVCLAHALVEECPRRTGRHGLDPADARADGAFGQEDERPDLGGGSHVRPSAELRREAGDLDYAHDVAVLLAEEHHRAETASFVDRRLEDVHREVLEDLLVDDALDALALLRCQRLLVGEIEAKLAGPHRGSGLPHVLSERPRGAPGATAAFPCGSPSSGSARPTARRPARDRPPRIRCFEEQRLVVVEAVGVDELSPGFSPVIELDPSRISHLAAACRIERRLAKLGEEEALFDRLQRADLREHVRLHVTDELGLESGCAGKLGGSLEISLHAGARDLAVAFHLGLVPVDVDRLAPLLRELDA